MCASDARRSSSRRQASARGPRMDRSISSRPVRDPYHPPTMLENENDAIRGPRRFTSLSVMNPRKLPGLIKPLPRPICYAFPLDLIVLATDPSLQSSRGQRGRCTREGASSCRWTCPTGTHSSRPRYDSQRRFTTPTSTAEAVFVWTPLTCPQRYQHSPPLLSLSPLPHLSIPTSLPPSFPLSLSPSLPLTPSSNLFSLPATPYSSGSERGIETES